MQKRAILCCSMSVRNRSCALVNQVYHASSFSKQPPHVLIIDASPPWWSETRPVLCEALENFFSLSSSLEGPSRVPLLSLYAVNIQQECLLPFVVRMFINGFVSVVCLKKRSCLCLVAGMPSTYTLYE